MSFYLCPNCGGSVFWTKPAPMPLRPWDKAIEGTTLYFCNQKCRDEWEGKQKLKKEFKCGCCMELTETKDEEYEQTLDIEMHLCNEHAEEFSELIKTTKKYKLYLKGVRLTNVNKPIL